MSNAEIDYRRHDPYLGMIVEHTDSVGDALARMALTARQVIRSLSESDLPAAQKALADVEATARSFLAALARISCPEYLKGADTQIRSALKLLIDAGQRGSAAVEVLDGNRLELIAGEMDAAADDIGLAARRITDWRSGAARP